jgi:hypothetical protein
MASRFPPPRVSRRQASLMLAIAVLVIAAAYLVYRPAWRTTTGDGPAVMQDFRNTCMKAARQANGGGDLVMDEGTEAKIGAYCGCLAEAIEGNVDPADLTAMEQGKAKESTLHLLDRIIAGCKPQLE